MNHGLYFPEAQIYNSNYLTWAGIAQSVQGLATSWAVRGWNSGGAIFLLPWGPYSLLYGGCLVSFSGLKRLRD